MTEGWKRCTEDLTSRSTGVLATCSEDKSIPRLLCQDYQISTLGSGPLQLSNAERQSHPSQAQCHAGLETLPYPRTALHWALQLSLSAQRHLRDLQAVLCCVGNTFCSLCQVAPSTWELSNRKPSHACGYDFFESLCLVIWKCGFGMLWELLELRGSRTQCGQRVWLHFSQFT